SLRPLRRRHAEPALDVIGFLQPGVEVARSGFRQLDARRLFLAAKACALDVAVEAFLGVVAAAVDGALIALPLLHTLLHLRDERRPLLRLENGSDLLRGFRLGCIGLPARGLCGRNPRLLGTLGLGLLAGTFLVGFLLGGGVGEALGLGLLAGALLVGFLLG